MGDAAGSFGSLTLKGMERAKELEKEYQVTKRLKRKVDELVIEIKKKL